MKDIKHLFDVASSPVRVGPDPAEDLARAHAASRARTSRRIQLGSVGLALAAVVTAGLLQSINEPSPSSELTSPQAGSVRLVAQTFTADPYTFDLTPSGWSVQDTNPYRVTIAPDDGSASDEPDDFVGKLVVMFDQTPPEGKQVALDGRDFWIRYGDDSLTVMTATRRDEPPGTVRIQYIGESKWSPVALMKFLGSVHVGAGALPGNG